MIVRAICDIQRVPFLLFHFGMKIPSYLVPNLIKKKQRLSCFIQMEFNMQIVKSSAQINLSPY